MAPAHLPLLNPPDQLTWVSHPILIRRCWFLGGGLELTASTGTISITLAHSRDELRARPHISIRPRRRRGFRSRSRRRRRGTRSTGLGSRLRSKESQRGDVVGLGVAVSTAAVARLRDDGSRAKTAVEATARGGAVGVGFAGAGDELGAGGEGQGGEGGEDQDGLGESVGIHS